MPLTQTKMSKCPKENREQCYHKASLTKLPVYKHWYLVIRVKVLLRPVQRTGAEVQRAGLQLRVNAKASVKPQTVLFPRALLTVQRGRKAKEKTSRDTGILIKTNKRSKTEKQKGSKRSADVRTDAVWPEPFCTRFGGAQRDNSHWEHRENQISQCLERLQRTEEAGAEAASGSWCKGPTCSDPPGPAQLGFGGAAAAESGWGRSGAGAVGAVSAGGLGRAGSGKAGPHRAGERGRGQRPRPLELWRDRGVLGEWAAAVW